MSSCSQNLLLWLCICFCVLSSTDSGRPVVTSIVQMCRLAQFEQIIASFVRERASQLPPQFVNFVSSIEEEYARVYKYPLTYIDFPVNQYRLIRRFSFDWPSWQEKLRMLENVDIKPEASSTAASEVLNFYKHQSTVYNEIDEFDYCFDLPMAGFTIARLHILYRSKSGLLPNEEPIGNPPLSEVELLELIGLAEATAQNEVELYYAFHWMNLFVDRMKRHLPYSSVMFMVEYVLKHSDTYGRPTRQYRTLSIGSRRKKMAGLIRLIEKYEQHLKKFHHHGNELQRRVPRYSKDRKKLRRYCFMFRTPQAQLLHKSSWLFVCGASCERWQKVCDISIVKI